MKRREFIAGLGAAASWVVAAHAQQLALPKIGFLSGASPDLQAFRVRMMRQGLSETGYVDGHNVAIEYRWADDHNDRLSELAADLVRHQVRVLVTLGLPAAIAAKAATTTIPIVSALAEDPVQMGLVASLNRPGTNLTGITNLGTELGPKRLEVLHELVPAARRIALLANPTNPSSEPQSRDLQAATRILGLELYLLRASADHDLDTVPASMAQVQAGALVISFDGFLAGRAQRLAAIALHQAMPAISPWRAFVTAGGLVSYGAPEGDEYRLAGVYTGRILRGEKPADLRCSG